MISKIIELLRETPKLKAKDIAKHFGKTKSEINSILYKCPDFFSIDDCYNWSLIESSVIQVKFAKRTWVDCESFEQTLKEVGCLFSNPCHVIEFVIPAKCNILLEAAARLLALCNQLAYLNKRIKLDFSNCNSTLTYLDRMGFFEHLDSRITVLPDRPVISTAQIYRGNCDAVVEFGSIATVDPDESIPKQLKNSFVSYAGEKYTTAAFTVISELFNNVKDHSETPIPGFAALQKYTGRWPHLQTVVSDSGKGILGTLFPVIKQNYPTLYTRYDFSDPRSKVLLLKEVIESGGITQTGKDGRGLGLKSSQICAVKYNANISVRQEDFELKLSYRKSGAPTFEYTLDMPNILGTHVCFDFFLD